MQKYHQKAYRLYVNDLMSKYEIPQADKDKVNELDKQWDELKKQKENLYAEYASKNPQVKQLIDLALLQNGLLKGEALSNFIKRSIELMK